MKRILGATLALALASLAFAAPQAPATEGNQPGQTVGKHAGTKGKGHHARRKHGNQSHAASIKPNKLQPNSGKPVVK